MAFCTRSWVTLQIQATGFVHQTIAFCDLWHELLGFKDDPPNLQSALLLQEGFTRNGSSLTKTLASVWVHRTPLASMPPVILLPASRNASPPPIDGDIRGSGSDSDADEGPSKRPIILLPRNASPINGYIRGSHSDSDMAERPSKRPRIESAAETPAGSLDPNTSHGASAHLQHQVDQVECEKVLCPRCNVLIDSINKSLKVHFRDQKQQEADSGHPQWHTLSSTIALPWTSNKQVRIYRHMDLKYMCPCGKYSHHDEGGIMDHLKAIDTSNQQMMKEHSKDAQRPTWSRVLI
ncbi:hypothetical protein BDR06DRAFT_1015379 [Suillus hirtellus]|nr:hypothetical protein BDR06DRAFT_1015379 [Suillus hirtellus]